ncbi:BspA family leucine-rich repeat surface protein [Lactobacillus sp. ESL0791]|uniref:BspA family leucine-rich repeat surface protein n=1 Tax=Lactobacillus sp. ESL0791 TaxID=2983234 RepID=UPI0023F85061|nr:BspA family leucine-rich repeat surface protein [Lactobacillus sp. ESL0791]MDF7639788.1 BspA family leucine-rich repeat surface protein [Lactobacillus sp. ESL0791]
MSKNNFTERLKKMESQTKQERFSIRKLTIGAASVLIGLGFLGINSQVAHAADSESELNNSIHSSEVSGTDTGKKGAASDVNKFTGTDVRTNKQKQTETSARVKLSTYAGLRSFLRDGSEIVESGTTSDGSESAASDPSQEEKENDKKTEAEQKLNAAATSLDTTLGKANEASSSDKYQHETPEKQQALQDAVNKAQEAINKYRDPGSVDLPEADQTKLLADINAAQDNLTVLLAEYSATQEQVGPQDGISLRSDSGVDGNVNWAYNSGTLTFTNSGTLSSTQIQSFGVSGDITKIVFSGTAHVKLAANSASKFAYLNKLTDIQGIGNLDTSAVTDMNNMFRNDVCLTSLNLSGWDTSHVTNMSHMFEGFGGNEYDTNGFYSQLTSITLTGWDTRNVTDMSYMFSGLYGLTGRTTGLAALDLSALNTSSVKNMNHMFYYDHDLTSVNFGTNWNTSSVLDMSYMFANTGFTSLVLSASGTNWNTSSVTNMSSMFANTKLTSLDLKTWHINSVTNMSHMFSNSSSLRSLNSTGWTPSSVTDMSQMFYDCYNLASIDGIDGWNTAAVTNMNSMFSYCENLTSLNLNYWTTSSVTDMSQMFYYCNMLGSTSGGLTISAWDTSNVTNMSSMFEWCQSLRNLDISKWDISKVQSMSAMFRYCSSLTSLNLNTDTTSGHNYWNIGANVPVGPYSYVYMSSMFYGCSGLTSLNISMWDTSRVQDMSQMFYSCFRLPSLIIDNWDTSNVTSMYAMFSGCSSLTGLNISTWKTGQVRNMESMFNGCSSLTSLDLHTYTDTDTHWDTSNVTSMYAMFSGCSKLTSLNISTWKTGQVQNMESMFNGCSKLPALNISSWNTGNVYYMNYMFNNCSSLPTLNIDSWDTHSVNTMSHMFFGCTALNHLDLHHIEGSTSWDTGNVTDMSYMFAFPGPSSSSYVAPHLDDFNFKGWNTKKVSTMEGMFQYDTSLTGDLIKNKGIADFKTSNVSNMSHMFEGDTGITELVLAYDAGNLDNMSYMFASMYKAGAPAIGLKYLDITGMHTSTVTNMSHLFYGDALLNNFDVTNFQVDFAEQMDNMFNGCASLTSKGASDSSISHTTPVEFKVDSWNPQYAVNMSSMFANASALDNVDTSSWDTQYVEDMSRMFENDSSLTSIGGEHNTTSTWNTESATDMSYMFHNDSSLGSSLDLSNWDPENVTTMTHMFDGVTALTNLKLGANWNTSSVTDMSYMFNNVNALATIDNNNAPWGTANVTDMSYMFNGDSSITSLDFVKNFNVANVTSFANMFANDSSLTNLDLSSWKTDNATTMTHMFDGASALVTLILGDSLHTDNWNTSNVTDMSYMFNDTKKLAALDLYTFDTARASDMSNMFNHMGADGSIKEFHLALGHYKISSNAWGDFKWQNIQAVGIRQSGNFSTPVGNTYVLSDFITMYNKPASDCPPTESYVMRIHDADNLRYTVKPTTEVVDPSDSALFIIKAHKNQSDKVIDQYPMANILSFVDGEEPPSSPAKSYTTLTETSDDIKPANKVIQSAQWLDKKMMDSEGNVKDGGVVNDQGELIADPTNTQGNNKGNAVIRVTYGDGTITNVPVKVELPTFSPGDIQLSSIGEDPDPNKAATAVATIDSTTGPATWGKSNLTYQWVKGIHDDRPLDHSDLSVSGDHTVAVKIAYTTNGHADGTDIVEVTLRVQPYSEAYPISINTNPITTHAIGNGNILTPAGFFNKNKLGVTNNSAMNDLITAKDIGSIGQTAVAEGNLNKIIDHLDWANGNGAPTTIDNGTGNDCNIVAYYKDGSIGPEVQLAVHVIGGISNGVITNLHVNDSLPSAVSALTSASVTSLEGSPYSLSDTDFKWSTSADHVASPVTTAAGTQHDYIIIDYPDGTTQAVPVTLRVSINNLAGNYDIPSYSSTLHFHAADDSTADPTLDFNAMKGNFDDSQGNSIPAADITKIDWATSPNSIPNHTSADIDQNTGTGQYTGVVKLTYRDNTESSPSVSSPINVAVVIDGASAKVTHKEYPLGGIPAAADFLADPSLGIKAPSNYHASYKWVDAMSHQELSLTTLNHSSGVTRAAIEVSYPDGTHQYLPIKLTVQSLADQYQTNISGNFSTHVGVDLNTINLADKVSVGSLVAGTDYQIAWATSPDVDASGLDSSGSKESNAAVLVTFTGDGSQIVKPITVTVNGAVLKNSNAQTVYLNDANLSQMQQTGIGNYYVNANSISSYQPTYTVQLTDNKANITVHYNDNTKQVLESVPFKVIRPVTQQAGTYQGIRVSTQQVVTNYSDLMKVPGLTLDTAITGMDFNQVGTQTGQVAVNYTAVDPEFSAFNVNTSIPVIVKVSKRPVDNSMANNLLPGGGVIQVPQYTDLPIHNNYAENAVTNAGEMPAGTDYTWDTANTIDTADKNKTDKTFVTVHYPDGSVGSVPVKVNIGDPAESEVVLKHNAYLYDKQGKRVNDQTLQSGSKVKTYGTTMINNRLYYIVQADKYYIKANNIQGKKRKLQLTAHIYDKYGKQIGDQVIYAGTSVATYGTPITINGQKYYLIDDNKYVKAANFPPTPDTWTDPTVRGKANPTGGIKKTIKHASYFYNKNGERENKAILKAGSNVVTYGKTVIKHKQYYVLDNDEYLLASNIDSTKRCVLNKAVVVNRYGKAMKKKLHKGTKVATYGKAVKIKGIKYYVIGDNQYVKASKLK